MKYIYSIALTILSAFSVTAQSGNTIFNNSTIHEIKVYFSEPMFWDTLDAHYAAYYNGGSLTDANKQYLMADSIKIDGNLMDSVGVRQKGNSSNFFVSSPRKPLKIDFREFKDQKYEGLKKLNLSNSYSDNTLLVEMIAYNLYRELGVPAPRVSFAKIYLNDQYWGLYNCVEQIDSEFLEDNFNMADGDLYKPMRINSFLWHGNDWTQYQDTFRIRTNEATTNHGDFFNFLDKINTTPDASFEATLNTVLDVDQYMKFLAAEVIVDNADGHIHYNRNLYLYFDLESGKFNFLPWDHNYSIASNVQVPIIMDYSTVNPMSFIQENVLVSRVQENPSLRNQYFNVLCFALDKFSLENIEPLIDSMSQLTKASILTDPYLVISPWSIFNETFYDNSISSLKNQFDSRIQQIMTEFDQYGFKCALGTEELSQVVLSVYPNPTESFVTVTANSPIERIEVYDIFGKLIKRMNSTTVPLEHLSTGQYIIRVKTQMGTVQKRIIKQ